MQWPERTSPTTECPQNETPQNSKQKLRHGTFDCAQAFTLRKQTNVTFRAPGHSLYPSWSTTVRGSHSFLVILFKAACDMLQLAGDW